MVPTSIPLGEGNLTLNAEVGALSFTGDATLLANNITLISTAQVITNGASFITITATGAVRLGGNFNSGTSIIRITSGAGQPINFSTTQATTLIGGSITLTSTGGTPIASNQALTLTASSGVLLVGNFNTGTGDIVITSGVNRAIRFLNGEATTLTGGNITLTSRGTPRASNQDLTIIATGNLTLEGVFSVGNDVVTGGTMTLTAGDGTGTGTGTGTGIITFTDATLTAKAISLTQDGEAFDETAPATFTLPSGVKPQVNYAGSAGTEYDPPSWAECASGATDCNSILAVPDDGINVTQDDDINLADAVSPFDFSVDGTGLLDLGDVSLTLITKGNIIFPAGITQISAGSLTLTAANIGVGDGTGSLTANLLIDIEDVLSLSIGTLTSTADLTIEAKSITLAANNNIIKARNISLAGASEINYFESLFGAAAGIQSTRGNLTLDASGDITIKSTTISFAFDDLTLKAGGATIFTKDTFVGAENVALGGTIKAESTDDSSGTKVTTQHNLMFGGQINFTKATTITGAVITIGSVMDVTNSQDLTMTATETVGIRGNFNFGAGNLVLSADTIIFPDDEGTSIQANNITLSGTIKSESADQDGRITQQNLTLTATKQIIFANDKATTITGADITLISPTAQTTASDKDLTITARGNVTLEGGFNIGNDAITGGTMTLTAGNYLSTTGTIIFTSATLTAKAIFLTQDGEAFAKIKPATFTLPSGVKPQVDYTGNAGTTYDPPSWGECASSATDCSVGIFSETNIILLKELEDEGDFEGEDENTDPNDVMIDLTNNENTNEDEEVFIANSEEHFIVPDGKVVIKATIISITAKSIRRENNEQLDQPLVLEATEMVMISADIDSISDLIIKAPQIIFSEEKPVRLKARNIMVELPDGMDMPDMSGVMFGGNNQNVDLVASGDIMLNNNVNIGFGTLNLQAAGRIMAPSRDVMIIANRIVYHPNTEENIGNFSIMLFARNDIHLMNNITANGNIVLRAGGSIVTPSAHTIIEAKGSSQDGDGNVRHHSIHFQQNYAFRQHHPLTLKAAGNVRVVGRLDRGNATITLDAGAAPADDTGRRGGLGIISPAFKAGRILCPNAKAPICQ